ncbi:PAS domain-containing protein [Bradyrhizobium sp. GM22.5]
MPVSKFFRGDQRICYANKEFETLFGQDAKDCAGKGWSILAGFTDESDPNVSLDLAVLKDGGEFLGTFRGRSGLDRSWSRPSPVSFKTRTGPRTIASRR